MKSRNEIEFETQRIIEFIKSYVNENENVVIPVSGGLDSDVVARLCFMALGNKRIRLFTVKQNGLEQKYTDNAIRLARDLNTDIDIISLGNMNYNFIEMLAVSVKDGIFLPDSLLDPARANCSLRTAIISSYQDKGYIVPGNSNRTEIELGFFLPFGDNLGHFKPIAHLYKSEVKILAEFTGSRREVISQPSSAGFWEGETDLEDMAYWLYNNGPVSGGRTFTDDENKEVMQIYSMLSQEKIDNSLISINEGKDDTQISEEVNLPLNIISIIRKTKEEALIKKNRKLLVSLERI